MIVYEREEEWVMIPQHHHGKLSGDICKHWNTAYMKGMKQWDEVIYAVTEHDRAWIDLDETPFWNDADHRPYSFIDFPLVPKLTFYKKGIDEVEDHSPYAGLLCSMHYHSFLDGSKEPAAIDFTIHEQARQANIKKQLPPDHSDSESLQFHYKLIQFCDNLSLYVCMQEPGTPKEEEFPWFKDGFREMFDFANGKKIQSEWLDSETISLSPFPLLSPIELTIDIKRVEKSKVEQLGLAKAYHQTNWQKRSFTLQ
ncbi:DUF3891 family protein [Bacillus suaedae]|uniref:DUF3891 family protein n=1 Tax=Halalkalibacter suaedae TaxID=2822140 RepID=A0A940WXK9_9BACI|nr:DUF3891 family protein [Bacillus suaedae]